MKIHQVDQYSLDWVKLHFGIPTASGADNLVTPEFKLRTGDTPRSYVYKKVAEKWREMPMLGISTFAMDQGVILEEEAKPFFTLETGIKLRKVGFITSDDGLAGCSPDALLDGNECGIEIKCPEAHTHVRYLVNGGLPKEYVAQVQFSMLVTGFKKWMFLSYRRKFPPLLVTVKRDERAIESLGKAVTGYHEEFRHAMEKIQGIANEGVEI